MSGTTVQARGGDTRLFIGVAEAANLLGVSRTFAYDMAKLWIVTNGADGIPAVRLGRRLLVNRSALESWSGEQLR